MPNVSLRTIGNAAGVSHMTVSLALRNHARIPLETRERIQQVARDLGYSANPLVAAWMSHRRCARATRDEPTIGFINCLSPPALMHEIQTFERFFRGAGARCEALGYQMEELQLHAPGMRPDRLDRIFKARGIRGLVVSAQPTAHGHLRLDWSAYAAATHGYTLVRPNLSRASNDFNSTAALAIRQLRRRGYRRIGLLLAPEIDVRGRRLWSGSLMTYQQQIAAADRIPFAEWRSDETVFRWLRKHRPEVIMTVHWQLLQLLQGAGYRAPEDIGLLHLDRHPCYEGWAGVDQQIEQAGAAAVDLVVERLLTNDLGLPSLPKIVLTQGCWRDGETLIRQGPPAPLAGGRRRMRLRDWEEHCSVPRK